MTERCLIVANQTLGGHELEQAVLERIARGADDFYIVVPMIPPDLEPVIWLGPDGGFTVATPEAVEEAAQRSQERLDALIARIRSAGGKATGEVGDSDPVLAVKNVLSRLTFKEVVVSTLPPGISRWLKMDLPSRISRMAQVPVTVVEVES